MEMPAGTIPVNALFVNTLTCTRTTQMPEKRKHENSGHPQAERRRWGMGARAYRASRFVNAEMPAGMVPVSALFVNTLITHPQNANAERRKHETKRVCLCARSSQAGRLAHKRRAAPNANDARVSAPTFLPPTMGGR